MKGIKYLINNYESPIGEYTIMGSIQSHSPLKTAQNSIHFSPRHFPH